MTLVWLRVASPRLQVILAKWIAAWRAMFSQVVDVSTQAEVEAEAVKAWKSIDQLS